MQKDEIKNIIKDLINNQALHASITGKGPTVFGIFENKDFNWEHADLHKEFYGNNR